MSPAIIPLSFVEVALRRCNHEARAESAKRRVMKLIDGDPNLSALVTEAIHLGRIAEIGHNLCQARSLK